MIDLKVGKVFRAKSGEILEVDKIQPDEIRFILRNPETLEKTDFFLEGPIDDIDGFANGLGLKEIDLQTYKPTGLTPKVQQ